MEQSRRDDLESLGYVLIYFLRGKLPWQGLRADTKKEKYARIMEVKMESAFDRLCQDCPVEFLLYFDYCHSLQFTDTPDYAYLRGLFTNLMKRNVSSLKSLKNRVLRMMGSMIGWLSHSNTLLVPYQSIVLVPTELCAEICYEVRRQRHAKRWQ